MFYENVVTLVSTVFFNVATVPSGTVATVQNLNERVEKKKNSRNQSTVAATVLHSEICWVHSAEAL